jgi:Ser/Thr protein kinase RdoA (MazF antagonist)
MISVPDPVLKALTAHFQIQPGALSPLGGGRGDSDGITYAYPFEDVQRVLKILAIPASEQDGLPRLQERLRFVRFLGEHGVDIVYPLASPDGNLYEVCSTPEHLFVAYVMAKRGGHLPGPGEWDHHFIQKWGRVIGKMHRITQLYPTWRHSDIIGSSGHPILGWESEWQSFFDWCQDPEVRDRWLSIRARLEKLPVARDGFGFIHNDPHNQNILTDDENLVLLDFDVANYHWFMTDISIALQGLLFTKAGGFERPVSDPGAVRGFLDAFMLGYETENHLDPAWLDRIDLFVSYRRILLFIAMQGWLATTPEVRASWKNLILHEPPILA